MISFHPCQLSVRTVVLPLLLLFVMGTPLSLLFIHSFLKLFEAPVKPKSKQFANTPTPVKSALDFLSVSQLASMEGLPEKTHEFSEEEIDEENEKEEETPVIDETKESNERLKFIPPLEAEVRMKLLYENESKIINLIWYPQLTEAGYMHNPSGNEENEKEGYRIFFVRMILVTPSRFRPPQHLHGESYEHPQNVFLSQVSAGY